MTPAALGLLLLLAAPDASDDLGRPAGVMVEEISVYEPVSFAVTASTATATRTTFRVLIAPTWTPPPQEDGQIVTESQRRGLSRYIRRTAARRLTGRGFGLVAPPDADSALTIAGSGASCQGVSCLTRAARAAGASHWLASLLVAERGHCAARIVFFHVASQRVLRRIDDFAAPCTAENLLTLGARLGARATEGANLTVPADLDLTPRGLPHLEISDIPDLTVTRVATSTDGQPRLDRSTALDLYERGHMITFVHDDGRRLVAQRGRLLTECDAWRAAWRAHHAPLNGPQLVEAPLPAELRRHCYGNHWEWAWLGVPTGALIAWGSWGDLRRGELGGVTGFTIGLVAAAISTGLALQLDEDDVTPEQGAYLQGERVMMAMVAAANAALRRRLELSDHDVLMAGMRL